MFSNLSVDERLLKAAGSGQQETVRLSLDCGGKIDHQSQLGFTALIAAALSGHLGTVRLLLDRKAAIDHQTEYGTTALAMAAARGHLKMVRLLLERGAEIYLSNDKGETALDLATRCSHKKIVKVIKKQIKEQAERKEEIESVFLGKQYGLFSSNKSIFFKAQPAFFLPNVLVKIIEDYAEPINMPSQSKKS